MEIFGSIIVPLYEKKNCSRWERLKLTEEKQKGQGRNSFHLWLPRSSCIIPNLLPLAIPQYPSNKIFWPKPTEARFLPCAIKSLQQPPTSAMASGHFHAYLTVTLFFSFSHPFQEELAQPQCCQICLILSRVILWKHGQCCLPSHQPCFCFFSLSRILQTTAPISKYIKMLTTEKHHQKYPTEWTEVRA